MQIIVLGMHRCGTSLATRLINLMGADIGDMRMLLPANPDNPKGFWERMDVIRANNDLLRLTGCNWYQVSRYEVASMAAPPQEWTAAARHILMQMREPCVIKDPRLCLTLTAWRPLLSRPVAVTVWRDPLEVARSLELRNGMPLEYGLALWEFYVTHALNAARGLPVIVTRHDELLTHPHEACLALYTALQKAGVVGLHMPDAADIASFIDPVLHRARRTQGDAPLTPHQAWLSALWEGKAPLPERLEVAPETLARLERLEGSMSGAPR